MSLLCKVAVSLPWVVVTTGDGGGMTVVAMSEAELARAGPLRDVAAGRLAVDRAAALMGVSRRQALRLLRRFREGGPAALASRRRGRPSNRRLPDAVRAAALSAVRERYADFGPTLAAEKLASLHDIHDITVSSETLRKGMVAEGLWADRKTRARPVHQPRGRRDCLGELVQIDGSRHWWFEDRGPPCTLLVFIDDATSRLMHLQFVLSETAFDYLRATRAYLEAYGKPVAFYSDRHSIFRVGKAEAAGGDGMTQFGRALHELNIDILCANSPQAKGRVERANKTLQDRLAGRGFAFPIERAVFATVLHRIMVSGSDRACEKGMADYAIPGLDGLAPHHLSRAMAWLGEELPAEQRAGATPFAPRAVKDLIEERLFERRRDLFAELSVVFLDTTSLSLVGEGGDTLGERGYSKDHRPDLMLMILGVVIDAEGHPVCSQMWPGNTADVGVLLPVVDRLRGRFAIGRVCGVADRGMISAPAVAALEGRGHCPRRAGVRARRPRAHRRAGPPGGARGRPGLHPALHPARRRRGDPALGQGSHRRGQAPHRLPQRGRGGEGRRRPPGGDRRAVTAGR